MKSFRRISLVLAALLAGSALVGTAAGDDTQSQSAPTRQDTRTKSGPRPYKAVRNVMKTKHDTVKNSISNVR